MLCLLFLYFVANKSPLQGLIVPFENLCLDESLILFKGRLYWRHYNPKKAAKFGFKTFSLVDSRTGFILDSRIFSGKSDQREVNMGAFGHGGSMVLDFLRPHFFRSHTVFVDNFFSSPNLELKFVGRFVKTAKICHRWLKSSQRASYTHFHHTEF